MMKKKPIYEMSNNLLRVFPDSSPMRLDKFFRICLPRLSYAGLQKYIRKGHIRLKGQKTVPSALLNDGDEISMSRYLTDLFPDLSQKRDLTEPREVLMNAEDVQMFQDRILYEDDDVIVWNKPQGLAVQGGTRTHKHLDGFLEAMEKKGIFTSCEQPRLVHRLDKDTSGIILLAKSLSMATYLMRAFQEKRVHKEYLALIEGRFPETSGIINSPLSKKEIQGIEKVVIDTVEGREAVTAYHTIDVYKEALSFVSLLPHTGRTHQLRVHCASVGAPIVGDGKYGAKGRRGLPRKTSLCLHAYGLTFPLTSGEMKTIYAPLPHAFTTALSLIQLSDVGADYHNQKMKNLGLMNCSPEGK